MNAVVTAAHNQKEGRGKIEEKGREERKEEIKGEERGRTER